MGFLIPLAVPWLMLLECAWLFPLCLVSYLMQIFFVFTAEKMERALGNLGPNNGENGIQVGVYIICFSLCLGNTLATNLLCCFSWLGQEEMSQLLREQLYLMQTARSLYLLWISSKNDVYFSLISNFDLCNSAGLSLFFILFDIVFLYFCCFQWTAKVWWVLHLYPLSFLSLLARTNQSSIATKWMKITLLVTS